MVAHTFEQEVRVHQHEELAPKQKTDCQESLVESSPEEVEDEGVHECEEHTEDRAEHVECFEVWVA